MLEDATTEEQSREDRKVVWMFKETRKCRAYGYDGRGERVGKRPASHAKLFFFKCRGFVCT